MPAVSPAARAQLQMHACVVLWGFTAILGKRISLSALPLVWWRMLLVAGMLALVPRVWRGWRAMTPRLAVAYAAIGLVIAGHWLAFYGAIKLSNASVAATCMALSPAFQAVLEPWAAGRRFDPRELLLGIAVVPGVWLVAGGVAPSYRVGIAVGALSAALAAVFSALNKRLVTRGDALAITGLEMAAGALLLTVVLPFVPQDGPAFVVPDAHDLGLLVLLAGAFTLVPFTLSLVALRHMSAFAATLVVNLEPVYAILLAIPLLGEQRELSPQFYAGVAIILGAVLVYPYLRRPDVTAADRS